PVRHERLARADKWEGTLCRSHLSMVGPFATLRARHLLLRLHSKRDFELRQFMIISALVEKIRESILSRLRQDPAKRRLDRRRVSVHAHCKVSKIRFFVARRGGR